LNNNSKSNTSKGKIYLTVAGVAAILMMSFSLNSNPNAYATIISDMPNVDDIGQSLECVIVVVGCDGTGSVGSSGDTIIGSNNGNNNNNTSGGGNNNEPGTLSVSKKVACSSEGGSPDNNAVCGYALQSENFPFSEDYQITVSGNNPNPSTFPGTDLTTDVTIGPGSYSVTESIPTAKLNALAEELDALGVGITTTATEDCTANYNEFNGFEDATGTMTSGGKQLCVITNTVEIDGGTVPSVSS